MKTEKVFERGALWRPCYVIGSGTCVLRIKVNSGSSDITSKTEDKISELQNLVKKHYMGT